MSDLRISYWPTDPDPEAFISPQMQVASVRVVGAESPDVEAEVFAAYRQEITKFFQAAHNQHMLSGQGHSRFNKSLDGLDIHYVNDANQPLVFVTPPGVDPLPEEKPEKLRICPALVSQTIMRTSVSYIAAVEGYAQRPNESLIVGWYYDYVPNTQNQAALMVSRMRLFKNEAQAIIDDQFPDFFIIETVFTSGAWAQCAFATFTTGSASVTYPQGEAPGSFIPPAIANRPTNYFQIAALDTQLNYRPSNVTYNGFPGGAPGAASMEAVAAPPPQVTGTEVDRVFFENLGDVLACENPELEGAREYLNSLGQNPSSGGPMIQ